MKDSKNNIKFLYLYRDAGNYKQYGAIIFSNDFKLDMTEIDKLIKKNLIDGEFFNPVQWNIPLVYEDNYDSTIDHEWYEFLSIEPTEEEATDTRDMKKFLNQIHKK